MEILYVTASPYEDYKGQILNLRIRLDENDVLVKGEIISIELMDNSIIKREIKIINPKSAGDYGVISETAKQWQPSEKTLSKITGPDVCEVVVTNVNYHDVKTAEEIRSRQFQKELGGKVCISPYKELCFGEESIYNYIEKGYTVPDKVIAYLRTTKPFLMILGVYKHPFKKEVDLLGPYLYTDGYYYWDRDTWKYVLKYGLKLPQEFIDHVMSDSGTAFIESCIDENDSWTDTIKQWKKQQGFICLLPDNIEKNDLETF